MAIILSATTLFRRTGREEALRRCWQVAKADRESESGQNRESESRQNERANERAKIGLEILSWTHEGKQCFLQSGTPNDGASFLGMFLRERVACPASKCACPPWFRSYSRSYGVARARGRQSGSDSKSDAKLRRFAVSKIEVLYTMSSLLLLKVTKVAPGIHYTLFQLRWGQLWGTHFLSFFTIFSFCVTICQHVVRGISVLCGGDLRLRLLISQKVSWISATRCWAWGSDVWSPQRRSSLLQSPSLNWANQRFIVLRYTACVPHFCASLQWVSFALTPYRKRNTATLRWFSVLNNICAPKTAARGRVPTRVFFLNKLGSFPFSTRSTAPSSRA